MVERDQMLVAERIDLFLWMKNKKWFGAAFRYIYTHPFWSLSCDLSIYGDSFRFRALSGDVSIYGISFLFGRFVQRVIVCCFSDSFVQMAAVMLQIIPNFFYKLSKKQPLCFCKHISKICCDWKILYSSPRWQDVLTTQLQTSPYSIR